MESSAQFLEQGLMYVVLPLWLLAGFADYCCHRALRIEYSAGVKEAALHLLLLGELGAAMLAALLFRIDAGVVAFLLFLAVLHELTAWWDLGYAASRRPIPVAEQWVHGLQQMLPWIGLGGLMALHPGQTRALFGLGPEPPEWAWQLKPLPLPAGYLTAAAVAGLILVLLPFIAEYRRCRHSWPMGRQR